MTALGERLAAARKQSGWSLRDVERKTGIANAHLWQIEGGVIASPAASLLVTLASLYVIDAAELIVLAGQEPPSWLDERDRLTARVAALEALAAETIEYATDGKRPIKVTAARWRETLAGDDGP